METKVLTSRMESGRFAIFHASYSGKSGYTIYDTQEDLLKDFTIDDGKTTELVGDPNQEPNLVF